MSANHSESPGRGGIVRITETDVYDRLKRAIWSVAGHRRAGEVAILAAGVLLARAVRLGGETRRRRAGLLVAALVLVGYGLRRLWAPDSPSTDGTDVSSRDAGEKVSDDAHAARERHDVSPESETNPRGTAPDRDATTRSDPDAGEIAFSEDQTADPRSKPRLDETAEDPRFEEDSEVEIDLSEASMADEASEATGPEPEQAQPTQTQATEPESSPPEDVGDVEADDAADRTSDAEPDATGPGTESDTSTPETPEDTDGTDDSDDGDTS